MVSWSLQYVAAAITGAAPEIGLACARLVAHRGAEVALLDVDADRGPGHATEIGRDAIFLETDVSSEETVTASMRAVAHRFGRFDMLINCAAIQTMGTPLQASSEPWERLHQVNLKGVFLCCRAALPYLQAGGAGSIVNISSILGVVGDPDLVAYCAMKGASSHSPSRYLWATAHPGCG